MNAEESTEGAKKNARILVGKISHLSSKNVPFCEAIIPSPIMRFFPHQGVAKRMIGIAPKRRAALATNK